MQAKHEKLAVRLTGILIQLNSGNRLSAKALAEEYKVSLKTIKRDLNLRLTELRRMRLAENKTRYVAGFIVPS